MQADLDRVNLVLRPNAEYAAQAVLLPGLIRDLLAAASDSQRRPVALVGLQATYKAVAYPARARA